MVRPVLERVNSFAALIAARADDSEFALRRAAEQIGRPLGIKDFIDDLERILARPIARARCPRRKPRQRPDDQPKLL